MTTRPTRIAQTSTEAKKLHKRNGLAIPERQRRQLERAAELEERAARLRDQEERRKAAKKKREEREKKERESRKHNGVGLATQLIGYSHTQAQMKNGMEAFLGLKKRREDRKEDLEISEQLEAMVEEVAKEPWDDDEVGDAFDLPMLNSDQWIDDDLDDDTLLEVHDLITSDPIEETKGTPKSQAKTADLVVPDVHENATSKADADFVRLHGPVNKVIEDILRKLPEPLIELLSRDISTDTINWDPAPSLLHKLNPAGLPPHRLRVKVGCVVTLLRDLNSSSQLSRSQNLQVLRVETERLECMVLDGQLEGTKTFLTKVTFSANHRNDERFAFQRIQFPVRVSKDVSPRPISSDMPRSSFKLPSVSGVPHRPTNAVQKSIPAISKMKSSPTPNPSFKLPGVPASKTKPTVPPKAFTKPINSVLDGWDDFLDSGTQIARELSSEPSSPVKPLPVARATSSSFMSNALPPLSTQDFEFSLEDLEDSPQTEPMANPATSNTIVKKSEDGPTNGPAKHSKDSLRLAGQQGLEIQPKASAPQSPRQASLKRKSLPVPGSNALPIPKRMAVQPALSKATTKLGIPTAPKPVTSFSELGVSTQEVASFFDDDEEMTFGTPPITT